MSSEPPERLNQPVSFLRIRQGFALCTVACATGFYLGRTDQSFDSNFSEVAPIPGGPFLPGILMLFLVALNGLFQAAEAAISQLRPIHAKQSKENGNTSRPHIEWILERQTSASAACNFGSNLMRLLLLVPVMLVAPGLSSFLQQWTNWDATNYFVTICCGFGLFLFPVGPLVLVFEQGFRTYGFTHPQGAVTKLYRLIVIALALFSWPAMLATGISKVINRRVIHSAMPVENKTEEEIKTLVESAEEIGEIEEDERDLIHSVFEFGDTVAREIMTPRVDLDALPIESDAEEVLEVIRATGHSRIPLYEGTDDQIIGIVHAKDLLMAMLGNSEVSLRTLIRPALFVPENKDLHELLAELRQNRTQLAIVQDEFGGTAGIVTIEDIVEELVGDIVDEYDKDEPELVTLPNGWSVDGRMHLDDLNDELGSNFETDEFDTVGGFVFGSFGRQPTSGESLEIGNYRFYVAETDGRRVQRLTIEKIVNGDQVSESELVL